MIRSPMMFGRTPPDVLLVETINNVLNWRPNTGLAQPGDLVVLIGAQFPSGFIGDGRVATRTLESADMSTNYVVSRERFAGVVLRNVSALSNRASGSAGTNTIVPGFQKADRHGGILVHTEIDPDSHVTSPAVEVNSIKVEAAARSYSPPTTADETHNLYPYLYPAQPRYPDEGPFRIRSLSGSFNCSYRIYELIAG